MTGISTSLVEKAALREVPIQVLRDHEQTQGGCKCGAGIGDGIDWKWHVANQATIAATAFALEAAGLPALLERVEAAESALARVEVIHTGMAELAVEKPGLSWGADYFADELGHALDDTDPEANR